MSSRLPKPDPIVDDPDHVVIRDKRRLDPESGQLRAAAAERAEADVAVDAAVDPTAPDASAAEAGTAQQEPAASEPEHDRVAELTADLQRVSAEYANYRKRVDRDRVAVVEMATAGLLSGLLPVLDDIDRARQHGDLTGAFAAVADSLGQLTGRLGLEQFGEPGEPFDPAVHEALMQADPDPSQSVPTCAAILQKGYRLAGGRVLRPARVSVAEPAADAGPGAAAETVSAAHDES